MRSRSLLTPTAAVLLLSVGLVCFASLVSASSATSPSNAKSTANADGAGISMALSSTFVNGMVQYFLPQVQEKLQNLPLSDIEAKKDGFVVYLSQLVVTAAHVKNASVVISQPSGGVIVSATGVEINLSGHYKVEEDAIGHVKICDGGFTSATALSFSLLLSITVDSSGVPQIAVPKVDISLGDWDIRFCKALRALMDLFHSSVSDAIKKSLASEIPSNVHNVAASVMAKIAFDRVVGPMLGIDLHLSTAPAYETNPPAIALPLLGQVYNPGAPSERSPFSPPVALPTAVASGDSVSVYVSSSVLQGAAWVLFDAGLLSGYKIVANSSYGQWNGFAATLNIMQSPTVDISSDTNSIVVSVSGSVVLQNIAQTDVTVALTFDLKTAAQPGFDTINTTMHVYMQVPATLDVATLKSFDFTVSHASIPVDLQSLAPILNGLLNGLLNDRVNPILYKDGVLMPGLPFGQITNANIALMNESVYVGVTIQFS
jgi:hypothetical protein